jgi:hypothetical protein
LEFGGLARVRIAGFLQMGLDRARAVILLHAEGLGHYTLASDKNAKRTGIDRL